MLAGRDLETETYEEVDLNYSQRKAMRALVVILRYLKDSYVGEVGNGVSKRSRGPWVQTELQR